MRVRTVLWLSLVAAAPLRAEAPIEGSVHARVSVTVDPDDRGTILVPSPFAIVPGTDRVVVHVPESGGIFLLQGERILHHFPLPADLSELDDMATAESTFVAGRHLAEGLVTVRLGVFDPWTGRSIASIASNNPHLRVDAEREDLWRAVIEGDLVGVFHPDAGASYPLWSRETGPVASAEQLAGARAGIGFEGETKWIPHPDGSVSRQTRGRTVEFVGPGRGEFVDAVSDHAVLLAPPEETVRADADGDFLLSRELRGRLVDEEGTETDFRLRSASPDVRARRLVIRGRPFRAREGRIYWIFVGPDYLEIRKVAVSAIGG